MKINYLKHTPDWAKDVVWYQIFPERFHMGHKNVFPKLEDLEGAYPHDLENPWLLHPWCSEWYELQPYEKANGQDIWYNLQRRRYGGDLKGVLDKLDYLQDLGIGALYVNPVFYAPSSHNYDTAAHHHVDPFFGPKPEKDLKLMAMENPSNPDSWHWTSADLLLLQLIEEVHNRNMRIILDGVFNHVGINFWAYKDLEKNQRSSRYRSWFKINRYANPESGKDLNVKTWEGFNELPEFRHNEQGLAEGPKKYTFDITKRWMDPYNDGNTYHGIDGWRLDVAGCIAHPFWKEWRKHVRSINSEAFITGEIFGSPEQLKEYLKGDEFDSIMNYDFMFNISEYFIDEKNQISTELFDRQLADMRQNQLEEVNYVLQNLVDSHDTDRLGSKIVNRDHFKYREWSRYHELIKASNPGYNTRKPASHERNKQKLIALFQMTYLGAPMVYYGDEAGMWGANDPCCRKPMIWTEYQYEDETLTSDGSKLPISEPVFFDHDLFKHYRTLIHIRNSYSSLRRGDYKTLLIDSDKQIHAFCRKYKNQEAIIITNNRNEFQNIQIPVKSLNGSTFTDVLNNQSYTKASNLIELSLAPCWGAILINNHS